MWINPQLKRVPNKCTIYSCWSNICYNWQLFPAVLANCLAFFKDETIYLWPIFEDLHLLYEVVLQHRQRRDVVKHEKINQHIVALLFFPLGFAIRNPQLDLWPQNCQQSQVGQIQLKYVITFTELNNITTALLKQRQFPFQVEKCQVAFFGSPNLPVTLPQPDAVTESL